jgi:hypothetical protein
VNRNDAAMGMGRYLLGTNAASSPRTTQMKVDRMLYADNNLDKAREIFQQAVKASGRVRRPLAAYNVLAANTNG